MVNHLRPVYSDPDDDGLSITERLARRKMRVLTRDDLDALPAPEWLVGDLLPRRGLALLAGSRGLGKTLLALDLAATVSTDCGAWCGRLVTPGPVIYIAREGFSFIPERVRAWERWKHHRTDRIVWMPDPLDLRRLSDAALVGEFAADIGAVMVVTDSARATGAGAEDTKDMGHYVAGLEMLRQEFDGLVLVPHNTGYDTSRERGSTLLPDACDTTMILEGDPAGVRTLRSRKQRDTDLGERLAFRFRPVDGTASGVLVPVDVPTAESVRDRLLHFIEQSPNESTGSLARALGVDRSHVGVTLLPGLVHDGLVRNDGTTNRPKWVRISTAEVMLP